MKTKHLAIGGALAIVLSLLVIGAASPLIEAQMTRTTNNAPPITGENVQEVRLTFENYAYRLEPSTLVAGIPVRLTVDLNSVYGCMRDVVIPSANVRKYVKEGDNVITFTPEEAGTHSIRCSMNMGRGTFTVVDADGTRGAFIEEQDAVEGSCGCATG